MTPGPQIGGRRPLLVKLEKAGDVVFWCACGRSADQPFCDGSHKGTGFAPLRVVAREDEEEALFCTCKRTRTPPFCDGSHNALAPYTHENGGIDRAKAAEGLRSQAGRADLDGGCYVRTPDLTRGRDESGWRILPAITPEDGSDKLSMLILQPIDSRPLSLSFASEVVLFVAEGEAEIDICGETFVAPRHAALTVRPGESFSAIKRGADRLVLVATVCPPASPTFGSQGRFDDAFPQRLLLADAANRTPMGERFYQVLTSRETGAHEVTQFIGAIPRSHAEPHRHLYEEALYILSGRGVMWTETKKAPVAPGDVVYLPRKQLHALECESPEGMVLAGSFFPAGSPAVNY